MRKKILIYLDDDDDDDIIINMFGACLVFSAHNFNTAVCDLNTRWRYI